MRKTLCVTVLLMLTWTSSFAFLVDRAVASPFLDTSQPFLPQRNYYYLAIDRYTEAGLTVPVPICLGYIYVTIRSFALGYESWEECVARLDKVDFPLDRILTAEGQQVKALVTLLKRGQVDFTAADGYLIGLHREWESHPKYWWR